MFNLFKYENLRAQEINRMNQQMKKLAFNQENPFVQPQSNDMLPRSLHQSLKNIKSNKGPMNDNRNQPDMSSNARSSTPQTLREIRV